MERIPSLIRQNILLWHIERQLGTVVEMSGGGGKREAEEKRKVKKGVIQTFIAQMLAAIVFADSYTHHLLALIFIRYRHFGYTIDGLGGACDSKTTAHLLEDASL